MEGCRILRKGANGGGLLPVFVRMHLERENGMRADGSAVSITLAKATRNSGTPGDSGVFCDAQWEPKMESVGVHVGAVRCPAVEFVFVATGNHDW